jgi:hypothetical protein
MVSEELIRQRSYKIWQREGRPEGKALEHWLKAKTQLEREQSKRNSQIFEYHATLFRFEEWQRAVQPRPRISVPPQVRMAHRLSHDARPAAA